MSARDLEFQLAFGLVATLVKLIGLVPARNFITFIGVWSCGDPSNFICRVSARFRISIGVWSCGVPSKTYLPCVG